MLEKVLIHQSDNVTLPHWTYSGKKIDQFEFSTLNVFFLIKTSLISSFLLLTFLRGILISTRRKLTICYRVDGTRILLLLKIVYRDSLHSCKIAKVMVILSEMGFSNEAEKLWPLYEPPIPLIY